MVVGGDTVTLSEVLAYTKGGHGIVLLAAGTGGLAAALAEYARTDTVVKGCVGRTSLEGG